MKELQEIIKELKIPASSVYPYGHDKAKIDLQVLSEKSHHKGKLILVSAVTPTPAGEGKTTVSIGLSQGLKHIGKRACLALRQPSMGPVFGRKGGATGGGKSVVEPQQEINMHFTGDFHAITSAHNLISAVLDNAVYFNTLDIEPRKVAWKRVMDMNDRSLRSIVVGMNKQGTVRESGFDITPASEIMACLTLATSQDNLQERIGKIVLGFRADDTPVYVNDLRITGAVMALLKDAIKPNLVQTIEGVPCFMHGGPFANIAHGCNSVFATRMAMHFGDYAVTEAGFAFDLGAEKFFDIKCRQAGIAPSAVVIVATVRALKMHGGAAIDELKVENVPALEKGLENLAAHLDAAVHFARPVVVAINQFLDDTQAELDTIMSYCAARGVRCAVANVFGAGGAGAAELAELVVDAAAEKMPAYQPLYPLDVPVEERINSIVQKIYGGRKVVFTLAARKRLQLLEQNGLSDLPICMAKTQNSLSDHAKSLGRPTGFDVTVRDFELANGAGFLVALCGEIMRMPAMPRVPNAERITLEADGNVIGL